MKFGVHRVEIVPPFPMCMGGYGLVDYFDSVHDPLTLTAVYLHDGRNEMWICSGDLTQFPDGANLERGFEILTTRLGCKRESILLNASHTHGGPLMYMKPVVETPESVVIWSGENVKKMMAYFEFLWKQTGDAMMEAKASAHSGTLHYTEGKTCFPINRRKTINGRVEMEPDPDGVIEDRLRLLVLKDKQGDMRIVLPVLACHPTSAGAQHQLTSDYVGEWRKQFETAMEGRVQMAFLQGCGGDTRPAYTRDKEHFRKIPLKELPVMGNHLMKETLAALKNKLEDIGPLALCGATGVFLAPCQHLYPDRAAYESLFSDDRPWVGDYARQCLNKLEKGEKIPDQVPLRLSYYQLSEDFALTGMDFEPVCGLGKSLEKSLQPQRTIPLGYTNGCFGYVPDTIELLRGGYEAEGHFFDFWTGPFEPGIENFVGEGFAALRKRAREN